MARNQQSRIFGNPQKRVTTSGGKKSSCVTCAPLPHGTTASTLQRFGVSSRSLAKGDILQLQKTMGNQAVAQMFGDVAQRQSPEEDELIQGKFAIQQQPEEEKPVQGVWGEPVQRQEGGSASGGTPSASGNILAQMGSTFKADFSNVKIHADSPKANDVGALAYTQGADIHFAPGQYQPETPAGLKLLGHELSHVVQQSEGRVQATGEVGGMPLNDNPALEHEANKWGERVVQTSRDPNQSSGAGIGMSGAKTVLQNSKNKTVQRSVSWTPTITPGSDGNLSTAEAYSGDGIRIKSAEYISNGKVKIAASTDVEAKKYDAGYIQTLTASTLTGFYKHKTSGDPHRKRVKTWPKSRDAVSTSVVEPWYNDYAQGKAQLTTKDAEVNVKLYDRPSSPFKWKSDDNNGKLSHVTGLDTFCTWIIARKRDSGDITYLKHEEWKVNWGTTFKYASENKKEVDAHSGKTKNTGSGAGKGTGAPKLSGTIANNSGTLGWEDWS